MYVRPFRYDFHLIKFHIKSIRVGLDFCAESSSNLFKTLGHSLWRVPGSACERFWTDPSICFLNQVMTCGCRCGSSFSAGPGPPVMNGIFKICHWTWASFLTKSCRLCLFRSFKFVRRPFGFRFLLYHQVFPLRLLLEAFEKSSWCWFGKLPRLFRFLWKWRFLGALHSLSPAVFFLWLYYTSP